MRDEPRPLRDESESALERALLGAGRGYPTSRDTRAKTLAALGLAGSATLAAGTAVAAGSSLGSASSFSAWLKLGWSKVVVGLSLAGAASVPVGYYAWQHHEETRAPHAAAPSATRVMASAEASAPAPSPAEDAPAVVAQPAPPAPEVVPPAPAPVRAPGPHAAASTALSQELLALNRARDALTDGNAPRALAMLDRYAKSHPRGRLEIEAEVLRIDALAQDGHDELARRRAMAFLRRHPNSLLAPRVRAHLDASLDD